MIVLLVVAPRLVYLGLQRLLAPQPRRRPRSKPGEDRRRPPVGPSRPRRAGECW